MFIINEAHLVSCFIGEMTFTASRRVHKVVHHSQTAANLVQRLQCGLAVKRLVLPVSRVLEVLN